MDNDFSIKMVRMQKEKPSEDYFDGTHFEGHGDKWEAIFGNPMKYCIDLMRKCVRGGDIIFRNKVENKNYAGITYPTYPKVQQLSILSLIELKEECNEYASSYPLMMGLNNDVKLKENYTWEVLAEGEFAAETENEIIINFFDPFYAIDKDIFQVDKTQTISLAGLAYRLEKLEEKEFVLDHGKSFEFFRNKFLNENPNKTEKDFKPPIVKLDAENFRMMIPTKYACEYEIATQIEEIEHIEVLGEKILKLKVNLGHVHEDGCLYCNIYVSSHVLGKYKPQIGDGISGVIWLTGFFN